MWSADEMKAILFRADSMARAVNPCREGDSGKFEVTTRDGWALA